MEAGYAAIISALVAGVVALIGHLTTMTRVREEAAQRERLAAHTSVLQVKAETRMKFLELAQQSAANVLAATDTFRGAMIAFQKDKSPLESLDMSGVRMAVSELRTSAAFLPPELDEPFKQIDATAMTWLREAASHRVKTGMSLDTVEDFLQHNRIADDYSKAVLVFAAALTTWKRNVWAEVEPQ